MTRQHLQQAVTPNAQLQLRPKQPRSCGFDDAESWDPLGTGIEGVADPRQDPHDEDDDDVDFTQAAAEAFYEAQNSRIEAHGRAAIRRMFGDSLSVEQHDRIANTQGSTTRWESEASLCRGRRQDVSRGRAR